MPAVVAAGIGAAGSIGGALISSSAAGDASKAQQATSIMAMQQQDATNAYNRNNTQPYVNSGLNGLTRQQSLIEGFNGQIQPYQDALAAAVPGDMTQTSLEATPGYQFTLSQGLKSTQNAAAARGLGVSGAALKGAAAYATGLSDQTYNTRFNQAQQQYTDRSNNLTQALNTNNALFTQNQNAINVGENAAVGSGTIGQAGATNYGNIATGSGNAQAAAGIAEGNALSKGINGLGTAANGYAQSQQLQALLGQQNGMYGAGNGIFGTSSNNGGNYNDNQLAAINNGSWSPQDASLAAGYKDLAG